MPRSPIIPWSPYSLGYRSRNCSERKLLLGIRDIHPGGFLGNVCGHVVIKERRILPVVTKTCSPMSFGY